MMNDIRDRADRGYFYITFTIPLIYKNVKNVENESIKFKTKPLLHFSFMIIKKRLCLLKV